MVPESRVPLVAIPVGEFYPNPLRMDSPLARGRTSLAMVPGYHVRVRFYNLLGQEVRRIGRPAGGNGPLSWDGRMADGRLAPSGIYLARVTVGTTIAHRKLILVR